MNGKLKNYRIAKQRAIDAQRTLDALEFDLHNPQENTRGTEAIALMHNQKRYLHQMQKALRDAERALTPEERAELGLDDEAVQS